jgi:mono/diheme cytochrome c family protein
MAFRVSKLNFTFHTFATAFVVVCTFLLTLGAVSQTPRTAAGASDKSARATNAGEINRGKYLVEGVAMCGMCHTPRESSGNLDMSRWLEGASVWLRPTPSEQNEPQIAPRLAGAPPGSDEEMITLLTTGVWRGSRLRAPMPQFRMSREDAESVVAYLRSLGGGPEE